MHWKGQRDMGELEEEVVGESGQMTMTLSRTRQTTIHYHTPQAPHAYFFLMYLFLLAMGPFPKNGLGASSKTGCA